ncbi:MAG TPA: TetR family transcriptional regulator [Acidimicrobiales bacterium]
MAGSTTNRGRGPTAAPAAAAAKGGPKGGARNAPADNERPDARGRTTAVGDATRTRLIRTAERLIAERGLDAVSVRDITAAADTNAASIHYHFQSKEGLVLAILEDLAARMGARRRERLAALKKRPTPRQVAAAMVFPTFEYVTGSAEPGASPPDGVESDTAYVGFLAVMLEDPSMAEAIDTFFSDQYDAYLEAFRRARPDLAREEAVNRVCFALHLVLNSVSEPARGLRTWIERHCPPAVARVEDDLIDFLAGAFEAP